jgi:hypothetical protein
MRQARLLALARHEVHGERGGLLFTAYPKIANVTRGVCGTCGGPTRRSRYGIMHKDCFGCRYLKMIYGPNITVTRNA